MDARHENKAVPTKNHTTVEQTSDRETMITRTFNAPAHLVFDAWTKPELLKQWWVPKSIDMTMIACEADVRTGGTYRFVFRLGDAEPMAFFGKYLDVVPNARLVWTNEESGDAGSVTTVTFEEKSGKTLLVVRELYPTKEALDAARASGMEAGALETYDQLEELLAA